MSDHNMVIDASVPPLAAELCETFFFGMYTALFAFSTLFMLRKGLSNRTRNTMLVVSVVMYAVSATHWALTLAIAVRWLRTGKILTTPLEALALIYVPSVNFVLSDCIILWRAWVLWNRRFIFFILPLVFISCTLVISVASAVFTYEGSRTKSVRKTDISYILRWCVCGLTISTNLWSTCLLFIRVWQHRRFLRSQFGKENATSKAERALIFLVESGALYLCIWLTFITVSVAASPVVFLFRISIVQIVGIYPTAVFVVVTMRMSSADILSHPGRDPHHPSTMIFSPPSESPTAQPPVLLVTTNRSSSDSDSFVGLREDRPTGTLASSNPEKGGKIIVRAGYVS